MARRFQPPPMEPEDPESGVTVDEQVVRKMLKVNPDMRKGRTTFQVKKALEGGESIGATDRAAQDPAAASAEAPAGTPARAGSELQETVDFFVTGKADKLRARLAEIDVRRHELEAEEQQARAELAEQVVAFLALLDENAVAAHGKRALSRHTEFLAQVGLTPASLLEKVRNR